MKNVRSLERGLEVLLLLNQGGMRTSAIARAVGLPRSTVFRLLRTLEELGYIYKRTDDKLFRLTMKVRAFGEGYTDDAWLDEVATPLLHDLSKKIVWPAARATFNGLSMVVRAATDRYSPLGIYGRTTGYQVPVLSSAGGRVYLACCSATERSAILDTLERVGADGSDGGSRPVIEAMIEGVRARGYALASQKGSIETAFSVPVRAGNHFLAALTMRFYTSALSHKEAVERFLPELQKTSQIIADAYDAFIDEGRRPQMMEAGE